MEVKSIINSVFTSVTYCLSEPGFDGIWLVDCGDVGKLDPSIPVAGVLLTHTHFDHIYGINALLKRCPDVKVYTNSFGEKALLNPRWNLSHYYAEIPDFVIDKPENIVVIDELSELEILGHPVTIKPVPGHDESCLAYVIEGNLFTGDAFIPGQKVVTNLPRCNKDLARQSESFLRQLAGQYNLFPGHSSLPASTL